MPASIFTVQFWRTTLELVIRGAAIGATTAMGGSVVDVWHLQWKVIAGMALSGGILSFITSLSSVAVGQKGSPLVTNSGPAKQGGGWNPVDPDPIDFP